MVCFFFFVKQKTSYEMRISDWSSDVCSSDLDVARIDPDGFLYIVDRTKDVIKSGGEWISSIDLENAAIGHPAIQECAVIAAAHPKWSERPLMLAVLKDGQRSEEHTSELQSLMRISYAVFCLKKKKTNHSKQNK